MTRQRMFLKMVTSSLLRRRSRMVVALLAVSIGATILSGLVTIYRDVPRQMGQEFRSYGANLLLVPDGGTGLPAGSVAQAQSAIPHGALVGLTPFRYETVRINRQPFMAAGTDFAQVRRTSPYWYVSGGYPEQDVEVLLGQTVASALALGTGSSVTLTGTDSTGTAFGERFTVSGVLQTGGNEEECIYLPIAALDRLMQDGGRIDVAECSVSASGAELSGIAERISSMDGVTARLVKQLAQSEGSVLAKLQSLVYIVTLVVLLLTMVCVATTMMAVVAERRKEIGLKKSLGASNRSIVMEFLGEGLFLGALGGVLGVVLGFAFAQVVSMNVFARGISFRPLLVPVTIVVSIAITTLACLLPVRSATDVDPALVLKGE